MKTFEDQNYYQILKVPFDATSSAIKQAFREALSVYDEDSLVTYSLFSEEQRTRILKAVTEAYDTLIDREKRADYNQRLIETGQVDIDVFSTREKKDLSALADGRDVSKNRSISAWVKKRSEEEDVRRIKEDILSKELVSGHDLKKLRRAFGIELDEIYEITRISGSMLTMIEGNQFDDLPAEIYLKFFLRSYAEIMQLDVLRIVDGYLKHMALAKKS